MPPRPATGPVPEPSVEWWRTVASALRACYRDRRHFNRREPLAELVFITLSLQTDEPRYLQTYAALRARFRTWSAVRCADAAVIARVIRAGGLATQKANNLVQMLAAIKERTGKTSLAFLRRLPPGQAEAFLCSLPGVGIKTARCVALYTLGARVFPIDVHCFRILRRLGVHAITREKPARGEADQIQAQIPAPLRYGLHVNLVSLGRDCCLPRRPRCGDCCIRAHCATGAATRS